MRNIVIVGGGYVGMAYAELLAKQNKVTVADISQDKVDEINRGEGFQATKGEDPKASLRVSSTDIKATINGEEAYADADVVMISVPTDFDEATGSLDCSAAEGVIRDVLDASERALIVVKSTVPVGFTEDCARKFGTDRIIFNPEFLREASAYEDCRHPERIIIGCLPGREPEAEQYAALIMDAIDDCGDTAVYYMSPSEAEAVKLFSNTYLGMRVAFFNELDSFAKANGLDSASIIKGVSADSRIGDYYNRPSLGYGGTCLPKDIRQLQSQIQDVQGSLIGSIGDSNDRRQEQIAKAIIDELKQNAVVGVYRLTMQAGSGNYRHSSVLGVIEKLHKRGVRVLIYEPLLDNETQLTNMDVIANCEIICDLDSFKKASDLIITSAYDNALDDVETLIY